MTEIDSHYDIIIIGSGFSGAFIAKKILSSNRFKRILILERGREYPIDWQIKNRKHTEDRENYLNLVVEGGGFGKTWPFTAAVGGSSSCWWANAIRITPMDFELKTRYGVGVDWPVSYDELEAYYTEAEYIMSVSGDDDNAAIFPRSRPYPQPPHRFSAVSRTFKQRYPNHFFAMPQARARIATDKRNSCCSNSMCSQCPMNAKFTVGNDMTDVLAHEKVTLKASAEVKAILTRGSLVSGVLANIDGKERVVQSDVVVCAANGIFNPFLLLKSGIDDGPVGKGLQEQIPFHVVVNLNGLEDGDGSAHITGVGYNFAHGDFRRFGGGGFYELTNLHLVRPHKTKWRQTVRINFLLDNLRSDENFVAVSSNKDKPFVFFKNYTEYAYRGREHVKSKIADLIGHLPIDDYEISDVSTAPHSHLQGTTVMGNDAATSVVDRNSIHHRYRNLIVLGSSVFPTATGANPTLTICALSLRAGAGLLA